MPRNTRSSWGSNKPARRKGYRTLRYWADLHDGRGYMRHTKTIEGSKRDGDQELARLRIEHSEDSPTPTLRECYERWYLPDIESTLSYNTLNMYKSAWRSKIEPKWGDTPVTGIKPLAVQDWLSGMTASQAQLVVKVMSIMLDYPTRYEVIPTNPMRVRYRMPKSGTKMDAGTYDLADAIRIAEGARGSFAEAAILSSLFGSCRAGESLSPLVGELEGITAKNGLPAAYFIVRRQVNKTGKVLDKLKTSTSSRPIVFVGTIATRMLEIQDTRSRDGLKWLSDNGLGERVTQNSLAEEWRKVVEKSGLPLHPYRNLRNSWRTFMEWELSVEPSKLEKLMGHKGGDVTAIHYNRPTVQMYVDAVADAFKAKDVLC